MIYAFISDMRYFVREFRKLVFVCQLCGISLQIHYKDLNIESPSKHYMHASVFCTNTIVHSITQMCCIGKKNVLKAREQELIINCTNLIKFH